jgi:hypothetical protein
VAAWLLLTVALGAAAPTAADEAAPAGAAADDAAPADATPADATPDDAAPADAAPDDDWEDDLAEVEGEPYRTPLAGQPLRTEVFGERLDLEDRDRGDTLAITLGASGFTPNIGGNTVVPFFAAYYQRILSERRWRAVVAFLVNDVDYAESFADGLFEGLAWFENSTIPLGTTEIVDGESVEYSDVQWGHNTLRLGAGTRMRLWPYNLDNNLQVQLFYQASYFYFMSTDETGRVDDVPVADVNVPPDTYVHGLVGRLRLDMVQRNIMELPHYGVAAGADWEYLRRDQWEDTGALLPNGERQFPEERTRDYLKASAYLYLALPFPGLSERHRVLFYGHAGWMPTDEFDRYNGFRLGGGPPISEAADLARTPYAGAMFDQFVVKRYALLTAEYRFELVFFAYVHLRATIGWGEVATFDGVDGAPFAAPRFATRRGEAYSLGITSGFLWNSQLYFEYAYDTGALRAGEDGHSLLAVWSKAF